MCKTWRIIRVWIDIKMAGRTIRIRIGIKTIRIRIDINTMPSTKMGVVLDSDPAFIFYRIKFTLFKYYS
jgi:hypothetical protein